MRATIHFAGRPVGTHAWRRVAAVLLVCAGLAVLIASDGFHALLMETLGSAERVISGHAVLGAVLFFALSAASAMFAAVSSAVFVPVAVVAWGSPVSTLLLWLGWCAGGVISYFIGRLPGRAIAKWLAVDAALQRLEGRLGPHTPFGVVLTLQFALPSEIQGYLLGVVRYPFRRYLLGLALAELPFAIATIHISTGLIDRRAASIVIPGMAVAALSLAALYLMKRQASVADERPAATSEDGSRN